MPSLSHVALVGIQRRACLSVGFVFLASQEYVALYRHVLLASLSHWRWRRRRFPACYVLIGHVVIHHNHEDIADVREEMLFLQSG